MTIGNKGILKSIKDVVGNLTDFIAVPFVSGVNTIMGFLVTGYYHIHGASFVYPDKANPVTLTSNAATWNATGTIAEVIPANAITKPFDLHWIQIADISAALYGIVDIYSGGSGSEVLIGSVPVARNAALTLEGFAPVQIPQQPANTRISCKFSDSTSSAQTVRVKFCGHVYSASLT